MAKLTISDLQTLCKSYVAAAKQAGTWTESTENIYGALDKIGKMVMLDGSYLDKLPELDGDELPLGKTIEEYFIDLTLPTTYSDAATEGAKDLAPALPSVESCAYSYTLGRTKIKTTVPYDNVERAALDADDAGNMLAKIIQRLNDSYQMFKFASKKQLLGNAIDKAVTAGLVTSINAPTDTESGEAFIKQIKADVESAEFAQTGGLNNTLIGASPSLVLYIKKGIMPSLEVDTMAGAFNRTDLAVPCQIKVVDDFGTLATANANVYALLVDPRGIKLHQSYHAIREAINADGDYINYVDHSEHTGFISKNVFIKAYKPVA